MLKKYDLSIWSSEAEKQYVLKVHGYYFWTIMVLANIFISLIGFGYLFEDTDYVIAGTVITEVFVLIKQSAARKLLVKYIENPIFKKDDNELDLTR